MRRPRLTIRRLMVLVAVLGMMLGGCVLWKRSNHFRSLAELHEMDAQLSRIMLESGWQEGREVHRRATQADLAEAEQKNRRYRAAQRRPWLPLPDDPE